MGKAKSTIKFLQNYGGEATGGVLHQPGQTAEVDSARAAVLVESGRAVYVESGPEAEAEAEEEEKPRRGRPKKSE